MNGDTLDNYIAKQIGSHEMFASDGASIDHIYGVDNPMVNLLNTMKYDNSDTGRTQFYRDAKALDGAYSTTKGNQKAAIKGCTGRAKQKCLLVLLHLMYMINWANLIIW